MFLFLYFAVNVLFIILYVYFISQKLHSVPFFFFTPNHRDPLQSGPPPIARVFRDRVADTTAVLTAGAGAVGWWRGRGGGSGDLGGGDSGHHSTPHPANTGSDQHTHENQSGSFFKLWASPGERIQSNSSPVSLQLFF